MYVYIFIVKVSASIAEIHQQPVRKAQDLQLCSSAVLLPVITSGSEGILACVVIKVLYHIAASSAASVSINIHCKQPSKPKDAVEMCWSIVLILCYFWKFLESWENAKSLGKEEKQIQSWSLK